MKNPDGTLACDFCNNPIKDPTTTNGPCWNPNDMLFCSDKCKFDYIQSEIDELARYSEFEETYGDQDPDSTNNTNNKE